MQLKIATKHLAFTYILFICLFEAGCEMVNNCPEEANLGVLVEGAHSKKLNFQRLRLSGALNLAGCQYVDPSCDAIKNMKQIDSQASVIELYNGKKINIFYTTNENQLYEQLKSGKIDGLLGSSSWLKATDSQRSLPHVRIKPNLNSSMVYIYSSFPLPPLEKNMHKFANETFFGQIKTHQIKGNGSSKLIKKLITSIDKSSQTNVLARVLKLSSSIKDASAQLYVETNKDFKDRIIGLFEENLPFVRISLTPLKSYEKIPYYSRVDINNPILYTDRLESILKQKRRPAPPSSYD